MSATQMTLDQIRRAGLEALARELGTVGMVRFLQQFETGAGDYTQQRHDWLPAGDVQTLVAEIQANQEKAQDS